MQKEQNPKVNGMNFFVIRDGETASLPAVQKTNPPEPRREPLRSQSFPAVSEKPLDDWFTPDQTLPPALDANSASGGAAAARPRGYDPEAHRLARQRVYAARGTRGGRSRRETADESRHGPSLCSINQVIGVAVILFGI